MKTHWTEFLPLAALPPLTGRSCHGFAETSRKGLPSVLHRRQAFSVTKQFIFKYSSDCSDTPGKKGQWGKKEEVKRERGKKRKKKEGEKRKSRRLPIFPGRHQPSIFSVSELNFRVRDGNGCTLAAIVTDYFSMCPLSRTYSRLSPLREP